MIAEVETEVLPSLRIQFVGKGSVIESLPNPRMSVKQPVPFAHGADAAELEPAGDPADWLPWSAASRTDGAALLRDLPGFCIRAPTVDKGLEPLQR